VKVLEFFVLAIFLLVFIALGLTVIFGPLAVFIVFGWKPAIGALCYSLALGGTLQIFFGIANSKNASTSK